MSISGLIKRQISISYVTNGWFVAVKNALDGVNVELACWKPNDADINCIWETLSHLNYYNYAYLQRHTSMLAFAKMRGLPLENYLAFDHPIQQDILKTLSEMCNIDAKEIQLGIDDCSAPNFAMPLFNAALGMARICDTRDLSEARAIACKKITTAMTTHPEMVSNVGEFDTELMKIAEGKIVTKRGAEGFQIIGIMPGVIHERGVGIALKVTDGDKHSMDDDLESHTRVRPPVALEILRQLNALNETQLRSLSQFVPEKVLKNYAGLVTGKMYPAFKL